MVPKGSSSDARAEADVRAASDPAPDSLGAAAGSSVGTRVDSVLAAAELAAAGIREEARDWARQHKEESRKQADELAAGRLLELSSLTEDLRARAQAVVTECDQLIMAVEKASSPPTAEDSGGKLRIAGPEPDESNGVSGTATPADVGSSGESQISDRARLFAAQLIAAGGSRDDISQRLREEFGIQDASAMLDRMGA
jgi:hypothetical protein